MRPAPQAGIAAIAASVAAAMAWLLAPAAALAQAPPAPQPQLANPASENCVRLGGTLEIRTGPNGQYGVCVFPDGRQCEEWALFRDNQCTLPQQ